MVPLPLSQPDASAPSHRHSHTLHLETRSPSVSPPPRTQTVDTALSLARCPRTPPVQVGASSAVVGQLHCSFHQCRTHAPTVAVVMNSNTERRRVKPARLQGECVKAEHSNHLGVGDGDERIGPVGWVSQPPLPFLKAGIGELEGPPRRQWVRCKSRKPPARRSVLLV